eukprot:6213761-Pleurochrysis_carterae.AAC.1
MARARACARACARARVHAHACVCACAPTRAATPWCFLSRSQMRQLSRAAPSHSTCKDRQSLTGDLTGSRTGSVGGVWSEHRPGDCSGDLSCMSTCDISLTYAALSAPHPSAPT